MKKLKPCPFCGAEEFTTVIEDEDDNSYFLVSCDASNGGCGASCGYKRSEEDAITEWNTRKE